MLLYVEKCDFFALLFCTYYAVVVWVSKVKISCIYWCFVFFFWFLHQRSLSAGRQAQTSGTDIRHRRLLLDNNFLRFYSKLTFSKSLFTWFKRCRLLLSAFKLFTTISDWRTVSTIHFISHYHRCQWQWMGKKITLSFPSTDRYSQKIITWHGLALSVLISTFREKPKKCV